LWLIWDDRGFVATRVMVVSMRFVTANNTIRYFSITIFTVVMAGNVRRCVADDSSCRHALSVIFDEDVLQENVLRVIQRIRPLEPADQFDSLAEWVLPSESHSSIRLNGKCATLTGSGEMPGDFTLPTWQFQSPVLELLQVADKTGRLDELRTLVINYPPIGEVPERCRLALLAMIAIFRGDIPEGQKWIETLEARLALATFPDLLSRWPETLMLTVAVEQPELHDVADSILNRILTRQIRTGTHSGPQQWDRHIAALAGRLRFLQQAGDHTTAQQNFQTSPHLKNWTPVSECDEATRALGFPHSHWQLSERQVDKLVGHQEECSRDENRSTTIRFRKACCSTCDRWRKTVPSNMSF
jgi:hypothetical protein